MELSGASVIDVPPLLNPQSIGRLHAEIYAALAEPASYAVLLRGSDEVFCRGLDLNQTADGGDPRAYLQMFADCLRAIRLGEKPVIALVRGSAVAGGVGLAAACDGVLAATDASFALTELLFGLTPAIIFPYLAQRVVAHKLRWMALTAQTLTAREAAEIGLVDQVCSPEEGARILRSWMRQLRRAQPAAIALWKRMSAKAAAIAPGEGVQTTLERLADAEVRAGLREYLETGNMPFLRHDS